MFYETMQKAAPAAWDLNEAMVDFWNPETLSHDWVMPDNFHVKTKVMNMFNESVHFLNEPFDVIYKENAPSETGRSLGANTIHSLDGMIVREITRRCDYNPQRIDYVKGLLTAESKSFDISNVTLTKEDKLVLTLWDHYKKSGYLSARIIDYLNVDNVRYIDDLTVISDLLESLPKKPFKVVSVHDCFRVHPNYGNDIREQYINQLYLIAKSNILQFLLSQILERPITIEKLNPHMADMVKQTEYALS